MNFNHNKEKVMQCFGIESTPEEISEKISHIVKDWVVQDKADKFSQLGERIHNELPYEVILFLATKEVEGKVAETVGELMNIIGKFIKPFGEEPKIN